MTKKISFIVDGFNLYHSVKELESSTGVKAHWLDLRSFLDSTIPDIGPDIVLGDIWYFTAFATHLGDPDIILRHKTYLKCLEATNVHSQIGNFKPKEIRCNFCGKIFIRHEEKETDVAIGVKLQELCLNNECDIAGLVTGDTDLIAAIKSVRRLCPTKEIYMFFPYGRKNKEFAQYVNGAFKLKANRYISNLFPDPVILGDGTQVYKPAIW